MLQLFARQCGYEEDHAFIAVDTKSAAWDCVKTVRSYLTRVHINGVECYAVLEPPDFKKKSNSRVGQVRGASKKIAADAQAVKAEWNSGSIYYKAMGERSKLICQLRNNTWCIQSSNFLSSVRDGATEASFLAELK